MQQMVESSIELIYTVLLRAVCELLIGAYF